MNDTISRKAVIDRINLQRKSLRPEIDPNDFIGDAAYRICVEFIERLPLEPEKKSVIYYGEYVDDLMVIDSAECPSCGYIYDEFDIVWGQPFCPHCGQALDWGR